MAEYLTRDEIVSVALNAPIPFIDSIPCNKGYVFHQNGTGIFVLRGIVNNPCACFARYEVEFTGNVSIPEEGDITPVATAIVVSGDHRTEYVNGTVDDPTVVPTPLINVIDGSLSITRIA